MDMALSRVMGEQPPEHAPQIEDEIAALVAKRAQTHGDFSEGAEFAEAFIGLFDQHPQWANLPPFARQSIRMQASKWGRIMAGDWKYPDHWRDNAGYNHLVADRVTL